MHIENENYLHFSILYECVSASERKKKKTNTIKKIEKKNERKRKKNQ